MEVTFKKETLKIKGDTRNMSYGELFDELGDYNIITASEIGENIIIFEEDVFCFTSLDETMLKKNGEIELEKISDIDSFLDLEDEDHVDFLQWFR